MQNIVSNELQDAYAFVKKAKFVEALALFQTIIQSMLLVVVTTEAQAQEVSRPSFESVRRVLTLIFNLLLRSETSSLPAESTSLE